MSRYLISLLFAFTIFTLNAQELNLKGIYQGSNLYVMNPFSASGVGFCIQEVKVNEQISTDEIASSAFEIDLSQYHFKTGDPVEVKISYKSGCTPRILNPNVIRAKSTFEISKIEVGNDKILRWTTTKEAGSLDFIIEQFRWNKWVKLGIVKGKGTGNSHPYSYKIMPHSGQNKFRVKQIDYTKKPRYSKDAIYRAILAAVTYKKSANEITFSVSTMYEIYNYYGNIVMKGNAGSIDISKLSAGDYFLNYDNKMDTFRKK